jgi:uncharacterized protein involved in response to NO
MHLGFRPFFLLAGVFAVLSIGLWAWLYRVGPGVLNAALTPTQWHAHEMIFGYAMAVVAGFLLTAVRNWTSVQTIHGVPLLLLSLLWLGARVLPWVALPVSLQWMTVLDLMFDIALGLSLLHPVVKSRQWRQLGIIAVPLALGLANALFYLGLFGELVNGTSAGIKLGLYLLLLLILLMGRRVVPFFITKGVAVPVSIRNRVWVDVSTIMLMIAYGVLEVFAATPRLCAFVALLLALVQMVRLYDWHLREIWRKPLLWSLYLAFVWMTMGFALKAATLWVSIHPSLVLHAFAYGGIGLITLSMMSRVSLGHTGRNILEPPAALRWLFVMLVIGGVVRVLVPMLAPGSYGTWIAVSQGLWVMAFVPFVWIYAPILVKPRIDGRYG